MLNFEPTSTFRSFVRCLGRDRRRDQDNRRSPAGGPVTCARVAVVIVVVAYQTTVWFMHSIDECSALMRLTGVTLHQVHPEGPTCTALTTRLTLFCTRTSKQTRIGVVLRKILCAYIVHVVTSRHLGHTALQMLSDFDCLFRLRFWKTCRLVLSPTLN